MNVDISTGLKIGGRISTALLQPLIGRAPLEETYEHEDKANGNHCERNDPGSLPVTAMRLRLPNGESSSASHRREDPAKCQPPIT